MEQRRVTLFLILTLMVFVLHSVVHNMLSPPPVPKEEKQAKDKAAQEQLVEEDATAEEERSSEADDVEVAEAEAQEEQERDPEEEVALEYVTIGSLDPNSPYRLLATLTNQGAAVERIELSSPRYRDLHDRGGYLGNLQLIADPLGGLQVQAIGAGTPLAEVGKIKVGDRLLSAKSGKISRELKEPEDLQKVLSNVKPGKTITLEAKNDDGRVQEVQVKLRRKPLEIIRPERENVLLRTKSIPDKLKSPASFLLTLSRLDGAELEEDQEELPGVELLKTNWKLIAHDQQSATFSKWLPKPDITIIKKFSVAKGSNQESDDLDTDGYHLTLEIEFRNGGEKDVNLAYRLDGPNGLPVEGWWYANKVGREWTVGLRDYMYRTSATGTPFQYGPQAVSEDEVEPMRGEPLAYVGIDAQYFSSIMIPEKKSVEDEWLEEFRPVLLSPPPKARSSEGRFANITCQLFSEEINIQAQGSETFSYRLFNGPKKPELLQNYRVANDPLFSLSDLEYYGWFDPVSKGMLSILHVFYGICGNYGLSIIMLTVLVRLCLFPISRKQAKSMAAMQALKPEMDRLKEKYKNDMQKQSQEMQELYRKHNINPLGGCLPMFIQLPIMMGLYRSLMVDVELRQAPLIGESVRWCSNLAAPDMFFDWSTFMPGFITSGDGIFGLGPYLNILPLVTVALFIVQQKMFTPEATNEQAAMQQKIMKYMMVFMGVLFYKVASGLCIYFITSSIWGIAERKLIPPPTVAGGLNAPTDSKPSGSSSRSTGEKKQASKPRAKKKKKR